MKIELVNILFFLSFCVTLEAKDKSAILDFEVDLIQAESQTPRMFVEIKEAEMDLEAILFLREDFNDFFQVDWKRHPRYFSK